MGSPQVPLQNTQASSSHISPISGPLFTEDRLSTSSEQEICDQEVTTIIHENTPTRSPAHTISSRSGSIATVDYSTQGDPVQSAHSLVMGLAIIYFQMAQEGEYWTYQYLRGNHSSWKMEALSPARQPGASQRLPPAVIQRSQSHAQNTAENDEAVPDLNSQPPPPRTVEYLKPSSVWKDQSKASKWTKDWRYTITLSLLYLIKCTN